MTSLTRSKVLPATAVLLAFLAAPALAQEEGNDGLKGFWLTTPYPELALRPGEKETIPLSLRNANLPPQRARIEVSGMPSDWEWALKGGGRAVTAAMVQPDETERLTLEITAPAGSTEREAPVTVTAHYGSETVTLPMTVRLSQDAGGGVTLTPELPALRGSAKSTFSYKIKVANEGAEDALFNLAANVPEGFQTRFKQGYGSEEITGLPVKAGATADLTMEVVPPRSAEAGRYPVGLQVSDADNKATAELSLEVTGQAELEMTGRQGRLSGSAVAGGETSFNFTIANSGSAPVSDVNLTSSPPQGWKITYQPEKVDTLAPGSKQEVNVTIHPSERAIAGDYMVGLTASSGSVSDTAQFRVTVKTATAWGMAGLGVIAAAVVILGMAIMRYGRR